jgi:uncharacterized membrane protein
MTDEPNQAREPTEEELRAALEEQMKRITVRDVLLQTVITLINLTARKLGLTGDGEKDLNEARTAIDAVRALTPLLPEEEQQAVKEPLSQLQMQYAQEAGAPPRTTETPDPGPQTPDSEEAERAKARSKLWTPPGT